MTSKEIDGMVSQNVIPSKSYFGGAAPFYFYRAGRNDAILYFKQQNCYRSEYKDNKGLCEDAGICAHT